MTSERTLFAFGCSEDVCSTLNEWLFLSNITLQEYQIPKRLLADVSRLRPEMILINVDSEKGVQLIDSLRVEDASPLLVGISSGTDKGLFFSHLFSHAQADYYAQRPLVRGFLDDILARTFGAPSIAREQSKVDIKELTDMVSQRDHLMEANRRLQNTIDVLVPERDRLQLQLAELLSASSKYGADLERLELEYERNQQEQEEIFAEQLSHEKSKSSLLQEERDSITKEKNAADLEIKDLSHKIEVLDAELLEMQEKIVGIEEQLSNSVPKEEYLLQKEALSAYQELGSKEFVQEQLQSLLSSKESLESDIQAGKESLHALHEELAALRADQESALNLENQSLREKISEQDETIEKLLEKEQTLKRLQEEEVELQEMLDQLRHDAQASEKEQETLRHALETVQTERSQIQEEREFLRTEKSRLEEELSLLRVEKDGLLDHLEEIEGLLDTASHEKTALQHRVEELEKESLVLREAQIAREEKVLAVELALSDWMQKYEDLRSEHADALSELEPLREDMILLQVQLDEDQIESQKEIEALQHERDALLAMQKDFNGHREDYEAQIEQLKLEIKQKGEFKEDPVLEQEKQELLEQKNVLEQEIQELKAREQENSEQREQLEKRISSILEQRKAVNKALEEKEEEQKQAKEENKALQRQVRDLLEKTSDFQGLYNRYTDLKDEYSSLEEAHHVLDGELRGLREREHVLQEQLAKQENNTSSEEFLALQEAFEQVELQRKEQENRIEELEKIQTAMVSEEEYAFLLKENREKEQIIQESQVDFQKIRQDFIDLQTFTNLEMETIEEEMDALRAELSETHEKAEEVLDALKKKHAAETASLQEKFEQQKQNLLVENENLVSNDEQHDLKRQLTEALAEIEDQSDALMEAHEKMVVLVGEKDVLHNAKQRLEDSLHIEQARVLELEEEVILFQELQEASKAALSALEEEKSSLLLSLKDAALARDNIQALEEIVLQKEQLLVEMGVKLEDERSCAAARVVEIEQNLQKLQQDVQESNEKQASLQIRYEEQQKQADELLEEKSEEIRGFLESLVDKENEVLALQAEKNSLEQKLADLSAEFAELRTVSSPKIENDQTDALRKEILENKITAQRFQLRVGMAELRAEAAEKRVGELEAQLETDLLMFSHTEEDTTSLEMELHRLEAQLLESTTAMDQMQQALYEKQEELNKQQERFFQEIQIKDNSLADVRKEYEALQEALLQTESKVRSALDEQVKQKAEIERKATERALAELEEDRLRFLEEKEELQEEMLRVSRRVQDLEQEQSTVDAKMIEIQELLRIEKVRYEDKLEQERRAAELERRIAKAETTKVETKNKALKLKLKRHFDILRAELVQTKNRLAELGDKKEESVPDWPFSDDDFI